MSEKDYFCIVGPDREWRIDLYRRIESYRFHRAYSISPEEAENHIPDCDVRVFVVFAEAGLEVVKLLQTKFPGSEVVIVLHSEKERKNTKRFQSLGIPEEGFFVYGDNNDNLTEFLIEWLVRVGMKRMNMKAEKK